MKKIVFILAAALFVVQADAQIKMGGRNINVKKAAEAGANAAKAVTLSDEDVAEMCREAVVWMDENNPIAGSDTEYGQRLARLTDGITDVDGLPLNFKVYHVVDVNAFASGDGSVRVFSALMDVMDDDQLMAIIGHEIGHVAGSDVKDAMKTAYWAEAARGAISSTGGTAAKLSDSQMGDLASAFGNAVFSRDQENKADEYGMKFCIDNGFDKFGMASSLEKLVELSNSGGSKASAIQKMFSSHPDSEKRAARMREMAAAL